MSEAAGRSTPVSLARRITCDFLHAAMRIPSVSIQKVMNLGKLPAARQRAQPRPSWCAVFTKAYARVVASRPDLRQTFLTFPWERIHQQSTTKADVAMEVRVGDETVVVAAPVHRPEDCPLLEIDRRLSECRQDPLGRVGRFRRALRVARLPRLVRRAVWWYLLNASARSRSYYFGTFGVTSVGNWGVESLRPIAPWTSLLHYGTIDPDGRITMRLTYDHRVLDGAGPATALVEMERVLQTDVVAELDALREGGPAAALARAG